MGEGEGGKEEEPLGDVVEEELAATSQAVEEAARRIQVTHSLTHSLTHFLCVCVYKSVHDCAVHWLLDMIK